MRSDRLRALILAAAFAALGGCSLHIPWYDDTNDDQFRYTSTPWLPQTVTIVDTRTGEDVWSKDVPVGECLILHFSGRGKVKEPYDGINMTWVTKSVRGIGSAKDKGRVTVPTAEVRRIDVSYRDTPELAADSLAYADDDEIDSPPPPPAEDEPQGEPEPETQPSPVTETPAEPVAEEAAQEPAEAPAAESPEEPAPTDEPESELDPEPEPQPEPETDLLDDLPPPPPPAS